MQPSAIRDFIIYDRPIYTPGSGPPLMPVTLAPPNDSTGWFIAEKIKYCVDTAQAPLHYYIVSPFCNKVHRQAVALQDILDWVSPKNYEDFEYDFRKREEQLRVKEDLRRTRQVEGSRKLKPGSAVKTKKRRRRRFGISRASIERNTVPEWGYLLPKTDSFGLAPARPIVLIDGSNDRIELQKNAVGPFPQTASMKRKRSSDATTRDISGSPQPLFQPSLSDSARKLNGLVLRPQSLFSQNQPVYHEINDYDDIILADELGTGKILNSNPEWSSQQLAGSLKPSSYSAIGISDELGARSDRSRSMSFKSGSSTRKQSKSRVQTTRETKRRASLMSGASPYFDSSHDDDLSEKMDQASSETSNASSSSPHLYSTESRALMSPRTNDSVTTAKPEHTLQNILAHEFRTVKNKKALYYLVGWECDSLGQDHVTWEPEEQVNRDTADAYIARLNSAPVDMYSPNPIVHLDGSNDDDNDGHARLLDGEGDSPTDQLLDDLAIDHYIADRTPSSASKSRRLTDVSVDGSFMSAISRESSFHTDGRTNG